MQGAAGAELHGKSAGAPGASWLPEWHAFLGCCAWVTTAKSSPLPRHARSNHHICSGPHTFTLMQTLHESLELHLWWLPVAGDAAAPCNMVLWARRKGGVSQAENQGLASSRVMMASVLGPCCRLWQRQDGLHQGWHEPVVHSLPCTGVDRGSTPGAGRGRTWRKADDDG